MEDKEVEAIELAINLILEAVDELQTIKAIMEQECRCVGGGKNGTIYQA